jgi:dolichyl-phosphate beta-glucosyltransferase
VSQGLKAESRGRPHLSVILPCYRAAGRALRSAERLSSFLAQGLLTWEIVIVDDGGKDFSAGPTRETDPIRLVLLPENRGKGAAVRAGMLAARGQARIFTDVDLPFDLDLLFVMAEYILERGFHVVIGDRSLRDSRYTVELGWRRRLASRVFSEFVGKLVTGGFFDTQCGLKGFRSDVAEALFRNALIDRFAFDVEVIYLALKSRLDIKRIPVQIRNNDASSVRLLRDSGRMFWDVFRIKINQMAGRYRTLESDELVSRDFALVQEGVRRRYSLGPATAIPANQKIEV